MSDPKSVTITLLLKDREAEALAQFCKRVPWTTLRNMATDNMECHSMTEAFTVIKNQLAANGYQPRTSPRSKTK